MEEEKKKKREEGNERTEEKRRGGRVQACFRRHLSAQKIIGDGIL